jgi:ankyrin repeat protein
MNPGNSGRHRSNSACRWAVLLLIATAYCIGAPSDDAEIDRLILAAGGGDLPAVNALLAAGVDANGKRRFVGDTALEDACLNSHLEVVKALLAAGANPNAKPDGYTPLIMATRTGNLAVIRALLAAKADVDSRWNVNGRTALLEGIRSGHIEVMRVLLEAGARNATCNRVMERPEI